RIQIYQHGFPQFGLQLLKPILPTERAKALRPPAQPRRGIPPKLRQRRRLLTSSYPRANIRPAISRPSPKFPPPPHHCVCSTCLRHLLFLLCNHYRRNLLIPRLLHNSLSPQPRPSSLPTSLQLARLSAKFPLDALQCRL